MTDQPPVTYRWRMWRARFTWQEPPCPWWRRPWRWWRTRRLRELMQKAAPEVVKRMDRYWEWYLYYALLPDAQARAMAKWRIEGWQP